MVRPRKTFFSTCLSLKCSNKAHGAMFCSLRCFENYKKQDHKVETVIVRPNTAQSVTKNSKNYIDPFMTDDEAWEAHLLSNENKNIVDEISKNADKEMEAILKKTSQEIEEGLLSRSSRRSYPDNFTPLSGLPKIYGKTNKEKFRDIDFLIADIWPATRYSNNNKSRIVI